MDATAWSLRYLQRQDARHQPWFKHLDFIKVGEEDIKKVFWAPSYERIHSEYIPIPLALRRDPQTIRSYYKLGSKQKWKQVERYALFNNDEGYYERLYQTGADSTISSPPSWPCSRAGHRAAASLLGHPLLMQWCGPFCTSCHIIKVTTMSYVNPRGR